MTKEEDEKYLRDTGWKIHSKDQGKKFWESPHDGKVYLTGHALLAQQVADEKKQEEVRQARALELQMGAEEYGELNFSEYEEQFDKIFPPPKAPKKKKASPKAKKRSVKRNIKELGF